MHPFYFSLFERDETSDSEIPMIPSNQTLPQRYEARQPVPPYERHQMQSTDSATVIADLGEQLQKEKDNVRRLEDALNSSSHAAENIVVVLLRKIARLRVALEESEVRREHEATKQKQACEAAQALFDVLCEMKSDLRCDVESHHEIAVALEVSENATANAIQKEKVRAQEVVALEEELRVAKTRISDELNLSRVVSQQVEGMQHILEIQHNEVKDQKDTIADLRRRIKVLENG
ncbi:uncharacterized protein F4822DRAFT_441193 [Hypoxylon trugodes]|uniref:uncharacterized protein n=1 Tax=Hypoxylon trugodes TaxID=326681 RepID=UPI0021A1CBD1|nr:uncharacterized protein F4822DRAFT_441193 [Hypoxylon trugodes]KAI1392046.1 hypothetical protein F4822DRAFT_441193 [Hypoxylon trugodes]